MKNLTIATLSLLFTVFGCSTKMTFPLLSEKIYSRNGGVDDKSTFKLSSYQKDARMKAFLLDSSFFLKGPLKDPVYILEGYNIETGIFYGRIWNANHQISYSFFKGTLIPQKKSIFTDYQIKLIANWDTVQIRKEEKNSGNWLDNNLIINGIRCYKVGSDWPIDEIAFKNFFNPDRDNNM